MKRKLFALMSVFMVGLTLAGCGKKENTDNNSTESTMDTLTESDIASESMSLADMEGSTPTVYGDLKLEEWVSIEGAYKGIDLTLTKKSEVTDEDALKIMLSTYNQVAKNASPDNTVVDDGETVNIDFSGVMEGETEPFEGGTAQGYNLGIGSGSFIAGFEEGLIGVNVGDTVDLHLNFPDPYDPNPDLSGAPVIFTVKVNFIHAQTKEDMLDEEIESFTDGEYKDVDSFLNYCKEYLLAAADYNYTAAREEAVVNALESIATVNTFYGDMLDRYTERITNNINSDAASYGLDADTYCAYMMGLDAATYIRLSAETSTKQSMIMMAVAKAENITVSDEEIDAKIASMKEEGTEAVLEDYDREEIREYLLFQKVVEFVIENANVTWAE